MEWHETWVRYQLRHLVIMEIWGHQVRSYGLLSLRRIVGVTYLIDVGGAGLSQPHENDRQLQSHKVPWAVSLGHWL